MTKCINCERLIFDKTQQLFPNDNLDEYKTRIDVLHREIEEMKCRQVEIRLKNEKIFKDFLFEMKNFYVQNYEFNSTALIDLITKNYKNLFNFNLVSFNYSHTEISFLNEMLKTLETTIEKIKAKNKTEIITRIISNDLNDFKTKTDNLKEKLNEQRNLIDTLMNTLKIDPITSTSSFPSNMTNVTPLSSVRTTSNSSSTFNSADILTDDNIYQSLNKETDCIYQCPKCSVEIESEKIAYKKYLSHFRKCNVSVNKACIFCFKVYELTEQKSYEDHVQKHMLNQQFTKSPTTTVSNRDENNNNINNLYVNLND